ncbi:MAG: hypothetical protein C4529_09090 [Deltaproteobacteria bacterium]|nr:MAG: hypothetical protein C4529_09090 [Deltaproteobacteria bacterium]
MRRTLIVAVLLLAASLVAPPLCAYADDTVGVVRSRSGESVVVRGGKDLPATPGMKLLQGDILSTGPDGSLGAILRDNSSISLGPDSRLAIRDFRFSPAEGKFGLLVRISRGTMAYLSGLIGKLSPDSARFETPVATIGIRGTRFAVKVGEPAPQ